MREIPSDDTKTMREIPSDDVEAAAPIPIIRAVLTVEYKGSAYQKTAATLYDDFLEFESAALCTTIKLSDIISVSAENYKINILMQEQTIVLSMIGHLYEDFVKRFIRACNEVFFVQSLMKETVHFETTGQYISPGGEAEPALFRICETAIAVLPDAHALVRIPFCLIESSDIQPYRFSITDKMGRTYIIEKLGRITDKFLDEYSNRYSALVKQTAVRLSEIAPVNDALARLMMEGLITPINDIRKASPSFADALENYLNTSYISAEYAYIKSVTSDLAVGIKRGLMGELTGENLVLLAPAAGKNRLIMESMGSSAATYVFDMDMEFKSFLPLFNESMLAVNFRREPIYLSDDALKSEKYENYRYALMRCPVLVKLRSQFLGRVAHSGFDSWKSSLGELIK